MSTTQPNSHTGMPMAHNQTGTHVNQVMHQQPQPQPGQSRTLLPPTRPIEQQRPNQPTNQPRVIPPLVPPTASTNRTVVMTPQLNTTSKMSVGMAQPTTPVVHSTPNLTARPQTMPSDSIRPKSQPPNRPPLQPSTHHIHPSQQHQHQQQQTHPVMPASTAGAPGVKVMAGPNTGVMPRTAPPVRTNPPQSTQQSTQLLPSAGTTASVPTRGPNPPQLTTASTATTAVPSRPAMPPTNAMAKSNPPLQPPPQSQSGQPATSAPPGRMIPQQPNQNQMPQPQSNQQRLQPAGPVQSFRQTQPPPPQQQLHGQPSLPPTTHSRPSAYSAIPQQAFQTLSGPTPTAQPNTNLAAHSVHLQPQQLPPQTHRPTGQHVPAPGQSNVSQAHSSLLPSAATPARPISTSQTSSLPQAQQPYQSTLGPSIPQQLPSSTQPMMPHMHAPSALVKSATSSPMMPSRPITPALMDPAQPAASDANINTHPVSQSQGPSFPNVAPPPSANPNLNSISTGVSGLNLRRRAMHSYDGNESSMDQSNSNAANYNTGLHQRNPASKYPPMPAPTSTSYYQHPSHPSNSYMQPANASASYLGASPGSPISPNTSTPSWSSSNSSIFDDNGKTKPTFRKKGIGCPTIFGIVLLMITIGGLIYFNPLALYKSAQQFVSTLQQDGTIAPSTSTLPPTPIIESIPSSVPVSAPSTGHKREIPGLHPSRGGGSTDAPPHSKPESGDVSPSVESAPTPITPVTTSTTQDKHEPSSSASTPTSIELPPTTPPITPHDETELLKPKLTDSPIDPIQIPDPVPSPPTESSSQIPPSSVAQTDSSNLKSDPAIETAELQRQKFARKKSLGSRVDDVPHAPAESDLNQHHVELNLEDDHHHAKDLHADLHPSTKFPVGTDQPTQFGTLTPASRFKFTVLSPTDVAQCLGSTPTTISVTNATSAVSPPVMSPLARQVAIVGNSQARAFYFQLLNTLLLARNEPLQTTNRQEQKRICQDTQMKNHDMLHELTSTNLIPSCPIVLPNIRFYYLQEFYDPVLEHILNSQPDLVLMVGVGLLDVLDSSHSIVHEWGSGRKVVEVIDAAFLAANGTEVAETDTSANDSPPPLTPLVDESHSLSLHPPEWQSILNSKRGGLGRLIRTFTNGGLRQLVVFSLPPICSTKYFANHDIESRVAGREFLTRVGQEIRVMNDMIKELVIKNGGNAFALHTYVPTSSEQNTPTTGTDSSIELDQTFPSGSSICSLYEDGVHPGVLLRKLVLNNLFNLECKKLKSHFDQLKRFGSIPKGSHPSARANQLAYTGWSHRRFDQFTQGVVEVIDQELIQLSHSPTVDINAEIDRPRRQTPLSQLKPTEARECLNRFYRANVGDIARLPPPVPGRPSHPGGRSPPHRPGRGHPTPTKPIIFLGDSNARALYFTFVNTLLSEFPGVQPYPENHQQAKRICDQTTQMNANLHNLRTSCPLIIKPPVDGLVRFIATKSIWDNLVSTVFESQPGVIISLMGYSDLASLDSNSLQTIRSEGLQLSHAIRNFIFKGGKYIELTAPPICESRATLPIKNRDLIQQNRIISGFVSSSGGNIIDTSSFLPNIESFGDDWSKYMDGSSTNGCSLYDDDTHPKLEIRKSIVNSLWNLLCQPELKSPFYFKQGDQLTLLDRVDQQDMMNVAENVSSSPLMDEQVGGVASLQQIAPTETKTKNLVESSSTPIHPTPTPPSTPPPATEPLPPNLAPIHESTHSSNIVTPPPSVPSISTTSAVPVSDTTTEISSTDTVHSHPIESTPLKPEVTPPASTKSSPTDDLTADSNLSVPVSHPVPTPPTELTVTDQPTPSTPTYVNVDVVEPATPSQPTNTSEPPPVSTSTPLNSSTQQSPTDSPTQSTDIAPPSIGEPTLPPPELAEMVSSPAAAAVHTSADLPPIPSKDELERPSAIPSVEVAAAEPMESEANNDETITTTGTEPTTAADPAHPVRTRPSLRNRRSRRSNQR